MAFKKGNRKVIKKVIGLLNNYLIITFSILRYLVVSIEFIAVFLVRLL